VDAELFPDISIGDAPILEDSLEETSNSLLESEL
jgi:hypothetical protein